MKLLRDVFDMPIYKLAVLAMDQLQLCTCPSAVYLYLDKRGLFQKEFVFKKKR